ncbi:hypothetical protein MRX96_042420 [Rhipicephalus microplus]
MNGTEFHYLPDAAPCSLSFENRDQLARVTVGAKNGDEPLQLPVTSNSYASSAAALLGARPPIFGLTRRPVLRIGLHDYVSRPNGILNFFEMVGGLVLFSMMSDDRKSSNAVRLLSSSACAFGVSSATMLMANISSPACAFYLPRTLYYVLFHGLGAICYLVGAFCVSQYTQEVPLHSRIGFCTGVLHASHSAYASFKVYVQKSSSGWF